MSSREEQYVGPYRLEKTLGKGQTGEPPSMTAHFDSSSSLVVLVVFVCSYYCDLSPPYLSMCSPIFVLRIFLWHTSFNYTKRTLGLLKK